jgi:Tol biopolymer transport system component
VGLYQVELKNIPKHCTVDGSNPVDVNVNKNNTTSVQFVISCKVTELSGQILFQSNRDGSPAIYKMKPDGSVVDQFTGGHSILLTPRESPDGSAIAFSEADMLQECTETRIIILNPDGSHKSNFTGFETCTEHLYPSWSTNGNKIAYISISPYGYTDAAIYKMRPDGSDKEKIKGFDTHITTLKGLDWSPTEGKLVYSYNEDLFTMTSDGANNTNLTSAFDLEATNPRWSPDAKKILFTANKDGKLEIFVMNANGTNPVNLTNNANFDDTHASWSPDGKHIVFMSNRDGLSEIYTMKADGSSQVNITNNSSTSNDRNPEWIQN